MIIDGAPATVAPENAPLSQRAVAAFLAFIERRLGVIAVRNIRDFSESSLLGAELEKARTLGEAGIIKEFGRSPSFADEPKIKSWYAICNNSSSHQVGGSTWRDEAAALGATLSEAVERYIWYTQDDYFVKSRTASVREIARKGPFVAPEQFSGYRDEEREAKSNRTLRQDAEYLWIQGDSLVTGAPTYVPAQTVSGMRSLTAAEPQIRRQTTNGLASWTTRSGAQLRGVLEIIEREAYMIMWLNQLTLPRIPLQSLEDPELQGAIAACERYGLKPHAIRLLTDAPTYSVAVVLEDVMSEVAPRFSIGLNAHHSLPVAIRKAMTEALRARRGYRLWADAGNTWDTSTPVEDIGHRERVYYWGVPENAKKLEFMIRGEEKPLQPEVWDLDTDEQHRTRIIEWCRAKHIECISVSLGTSAKNPTAFFIEMVVMPQLQPTYLTEATRALGGTRWSEVPRLFGHKPRAQPFTDAPHPFS